MAIERTFSIIKPDATRRNLTGKINAVIEGAGLRIVAQKRLQWTRAQADQLVAGLIHHSDAGSQYTSIRYTDRLIDAGAIASIGSVGDSFDNALAESTIGLYKTELIRRQGPWRNAEHVELATLTYVDWFNQRRLHSELGDIPPAEFEHDYYARTRTEHQVPTPTRT